VSRAVRQVASVADARKRARRRQRRAQLERRARALRADSQVMMQAELQRRTACRRSGAHAWVEGWCPDCGAIDERGPLAERMRQCSAPAVDAAPATI
jgi:hypothetical protein